MIHKSPTFAEAPAFPSALGSGLPARDVFALVAVHALLCADGTSGSPEDFARVSYAVADSMLAARSIKEEK